MRALEIILSFVCTFGAVFLFLTQGFPSFIRVHYKGPYLIVRELLNQILVPFLLSIVLLLCFGDQACGQIFGCTDSIAINFDSNATDDDGTCEYILGCLDTTAANFNPLAQMDPGDACLFGNYGIEIERYYAYDGTVPGYPEGYHTYRIYVYGEDSLDLLQSVFSDQLTTSTGYITTNGTGEFWNHSEGGITALDIGPFIFESQPALAYDSFLTIGMENNLDPGYFLADAGTPNEAFHWSFLDGTADLEFESGIWITIPDFENGFLGEDHRVLIAQITTSAALEGRLSFNVKPAIDPLSTFSFVDVIFRTDEFASCTDPLALNYTSDNGQWSEDCVYGDYYLEVEAYYDDDSTVENYPSNFSTYRIWAHMDGAADAITQVYSLYNIDPVQIESTGDFWNTNDGGIEGGDLDPSLFDESPNIQYDSFITIGRETSTDPGTPVFHYDVEPSNTFQTSFGFQSALFNLQQGGWISEEGAANTIANADGKILLGQVTTDGQLSGQLNLHVVREDGSTFEWIGATFEGPEPPGCTDPEAINFDILATVEDGSCQYEPCFLDDLAVSWCLWDEDGQFWQPGLFVTPTYSGYCDDWEITISELETLEVEWTLTSDDVALPANGETVLILDEELLTCSGHMLEVSMGNSVYNAIFYASTCGQMIGCTDPFASNYDSMAECDDNSCLYDPCSIEEIAISWICELTNDTLIQGFEINSTTSGYCPLESIHITNADNSLDEWIYDLPDNIISGISWFVPFTAPADNLTNVAVYAPNLVSLTAVQIYACIPGCTDESALNYNPEATVDDGSCELLDCTENLVELNMHVAYFGNEIGWSFTDMAEDVLYQGSSYNDNTTWVEDMCLADGCYMLHLTDQFGDGWNGSEYEIVFGGDLIGSGTLETGYSTMDIIAVNASCPVDGCMDPMATNYNPFATISDGNCIFESFEFNDSEDFDTDFIGNIDQTAGTQLDFDLQHLRAGVRYHIRVYNSLGRMVIDAIYDAEIANPHIALPMHENSAGVYYLSVDSPFGRQSKQFIKL